MKNRSKQIDEELAALARMREEDIDTSDIPETRDWSGAAVGKFYRPLKEAVSLRIDADVLTWFRSQGPGYQTRINDLLRTAMLSARSAGQQPRQVDGGAVRCRTFHYPGLERHRELSKCETIAGSIVTRGSLFSPVQ